MINYILLHIVVYLGLFLGINLAKKTKEEIKPGIPFFKIIKIILPLLLIILVFLFKEINLFWFLSGIMIGLILPFTYLYFGLIMTAFWDNPSQLIIISAIIFIFCLTDGTLAYSKKNIKTKYLLGSLIFISLIFGIFFLELSTHTLNISIILGSVFSSSELKKFQIKSFFLKKS